MLRKSVIHDSQNALEYSKNAREFKFELNIFEYIQTFTMAHLQRGCGESIHVQVDAIEIFIFHLRAFYF